MKKSLMMWPMISAMVLSLAANAQTGTHLDANQCRDLAAIKAHAPVTHARNLSELAMLSKAGYKPWLNADSLYPDDIQAAQRRVEAWYEAECPQAHETQ